MASIDNEFETETINDVDTSVGNVGTEKEIREPEAIHQTADPHNPEIEPAVSEEIPVEETSQSDFDNKEYTQEEVSNSSRQNHVEGENNS